MLVQASQGQFMIQDFFLDSILFQNFIHGEMGNGVLLGDSGYGLTPFLLTPISNPSTNSERLFMSCKDTS